MQPVVKSLVQLGSLAVGTDGVIDAAERLLFEHNIIGLQHPMCES